MRDTLASILKDISIITQHTNQGVTEQELALDNMRQIKEELLSGFQVTLLQVRGNVKTALKVQSNTTKAK